MNSDRSQIDSVLLVSTSEAGVDPESESESESTPEGRSRSRSRSHLKPRRLRSPVYNFLG